VVKPVRRAKRDNRKFYTILGAVGLVGVLAITYAATRSTAATPIDVDPNAVFDGKVEGYVMGSATAPVEIVEYGDFECGACAQFAIVTEHDIRAKLVQTGQARFRFFDFPLPGHMNSVPAHLAAACANDQGKFWEMHDQLFSNQHKWNGQVTRNPKGQFESYAKAIGLDQDAWETCYDDRRHLPRIQASVAQGNQLRVNSTPSFIIGGKLYSGGLSYDQIKHLTDSLAASVKTEKPVIGQ
jgi:protein-disulfide isomerase